MKASDVRKQWKEVLDRAANGEVIKIERAGIIFYLGTDKGIDGGMSRVVDSAMKLGEHIATHKQAPKQFLDATQSGNISHLVLPTDGTAKPRTTIKLEPLVTLKPVCRYDGTPLDDRGRCMQKGCKNS